MQICNTTEAINHLLELGVAKLSKDYPKINFSNILTDLMYAQFFKQSLLLTKDNLPTAQHVLNSDNAKAMTYYINGITILVAKIDKNLNLEEK